MSHIVGGNVSSGGGGIGVGRLVRLLILRQIVQTDALTHRIHSDSHSKQHDPFGTTITTTATATGLRTRARIMTIMTTLRTAARHLAGATSETPKKKEAERPHLMMEAVSQIYSIQAWTTWSQGAKPSFPTPSIRGIYCSVYLSLVFIGFCVDMGSSWIFY